MTLATVRPAAVAGAFYPGEGAVLAASIDAMLDAARVDAGEPSPKAVVVPHAGYIYSGPTAASAFARLRPAAATCTRVVLVGPAHRVPLRGLAWPAARFMETPLGEVPVDVAALSLVPEVEPSAYAHAEEHSLEVELPFLQRVLPLAKVVPIAVGAVAPRVVANVLAKLWGGRETVVVVSSDLSHYLPYAAGRALDHETVANVLALNDAAIDHERACGATGLRGLMLLAHERRLTPKLLDLRSSGDTAGDRRRVVGYAALGFYEPSPRGGAS